jgi:hypothetical protein
MLLFVITHILVVVDDYATLAQLRLLLLVV